MGFSLLFKSQVSLHLLIFYIIITFSYFYHFVIQVRKGDTIGEFLRAIQQQLAPEFREIRTTSVENLLYVKEDLIIPHV
jgi:protein FAM50